MKSITEQVAPSGKEHVLIVEDDAILAEYYKEILLSHAWDVVSVNTGKAALEYLKDNPVDVILLDIYLPDTTGIELLKYIRSEGLQVVVVAITSQGSMELAIEAMRYGAYDFLQKPIDTDRLLVTLGNALKHLKLSSAVHSYTNIFERNQFHGLIGASLAMQSVFRIIESSASSKATVFIMGESGTGKELCAEAIHKQSARRDKPFIALNCAAIPKDLMESEIFGHVKGAFTGATSNREGAAAQADGGTLFLDEICEMDLELQSKFLRFFQSRRFQKVGDSKEQEADVRFICATNKDPVEQVKKGLFREDLFYRLHVVPITMPPVRDRDDDVLLIARQFLISFAKEEGKKFKQFSPDVEAILRSYSWPGNVREIQNVVRNIAVLHSGKAVTKKMLPAPLDEVASVTPIPNNISVLTPVGTSKKNNAKSADQEATSQGNDQRPIVPLWKVEMEAIESAITQCKGNIQKAADLLDINPSTIYRKRKKWQSPVE